MMKREGRTIYVPVPSSHLRNLIARGSGIVGTPQGNGRVLIDYEGNLYGAENLKTYEERVYHAHDHHTWGAYGYPTVARALVEAKELEPVGSFDPETKTVQINEHGILDEWLMDPADLDENAEFPREIL
jgi:hypothetical protein